MDIKFFTSEEILAAEDLYHIQELASQGRPVNYILTAAEIGWLNFARGKFAVADYILDNSVIELATEGSEAECKMMVTFTDAEELSRVMYEDGASAGKAQCLADDTALQAILFWLYMEPLENVLFE